MTTALSTQQKQWLVGKYRSTVVSRTFSPGLPNSAEEVEYYGGYLIAESVSKANAIFISAAPDLYDALEMVRDADEDCKRDGLPTIPPIARMKIDAALAKAEGK